MNIKELYSMHIEEFKRFENGHTYIIAFDDEGTIREAKIYVPEIDRDLDITSFVQESEYWQARVYEWLVNSPAVRKEHENFKRHKEAGNE